MIVHLMHHAVSAKRFVEPLVSYLADRNVEAQLWVEPRAELMAFVSEIKCPLAFAWFDLSANPAKSLLRMFRLWAKMRKLMPNVVCAHQSRGALIPLLAARLAGIKIRIYHNHGAPYLGYSGLLRKLLQFLDFLNCALASHVTTVSRSLQRQLVSDGVVTPSKISVIGNGSACGISLEEFPRECLSEERIVGARQELGISREDYVVMYVGRPVRRKGFDLLLNAWKNSSLGEGHSKLLVVGCSSEDVARVIGGLLPTVMAFGYVQDVKKYYLACDVVVLPSMHEGLPYSMLEGAASGKPLVGSDVPGINSIVEHEKNGLLFRAFDAEGLMRELVRLKNDPPLRRSLGEKGRKIVEECYDRRAFVRHFGSYLNGILSGP